MTGQDAKDISQLKSKFRVRLCNAGLMFVMRLSASGSTARSQTLVRCISMFAGGLNLVPMFRSTTCVGRCVPICGPCSDVVFRSDQTLQSSFCDRGLRAVIRDCAFGQRS